MWLNSWDFTPLIFYYNINLKYSFLFTRASKDAEANTWK